MSPLTVFDLFLVGLNLLSIGMNMIAFGNWQRDRAELARIANTEGITISAADMPFHTLN